MNLRTNSFNRADRIAEGNRFLIGNGHLGYRGVLIEENKSSMKGFNIVGVYDQYEDKWRESLNLADPLSFRTFFEGKEEDVNSVDPEEHVLKLVLDEEILYRRSVFHDYVIETERFLSFKDDGILAARVKITVRNAGKFTFEYGMDTDIYDINGPHFRNKIIKEMKDGIVFIGTTNEGKQIFQEARYSVFDKEYLGNGFYRTTVDLKKGEIFTLDIICSVSEEHEDSEMTTKSYDILKKEHTEIFANLFEKAKISLKGDDEADFEANYSIYSLLILGDRNRSRSIPARGVSGQTYKGAIFWDTEIFLLPFFSFNEPDVARRLLQYRINTLEGAKKKAKEFGYEGAFFAWESQEDGLERCSKYNVTDYKTGKPIRTYFNEKQIHISADIVYALENYMKITGDHSLLSEGGMELLVECCLFFVSYSHLRDGKYHLDDVIGPDEYHERVNDNAFTNYMAHHAAKFTIRMLECNPTYLSEYRNEYGKIKDFYENVYLPKPNENGVIPQFDGYFEKEDCTIDEVRARLKDPKQYWGGKDGPVGPTQIIKQADVVAMLVLLGDDFDIDVKKANYEYYFPRTEHGSSLSSSMYSLLATEIGDSEYAYRMFRKSSSIDLYGPQKLFAGGIYIGGTHPASAGGSYMSILYGFSGLKIVNGELHVSNRLPLEMKELRFSLMFRGKRYRISIDKSRSIVEETDMKE